MLRLLVISDTHYPLRKISGEFYSLLLDAEGQTRFNGIIHCGDIQEIDFYEDLLTYEIPLYAVLGNNYDFLLERKIPFRRVINLTGLNIGIVHGHGSFFPAIENAKKEFCKDKVDIVCYGHSHIASIDTIGEKLFINPGSLTSGRNGKNTYAIIEIDGSKKKTSIHDLSNEI